MKSNFTRGASVTPLESDAWRLEIPAGPKGRYRLAQLDDYADLARRSFPWRPPVTLSLRARVSSPVSSIDSGQIPGTWGVGLWNDPFSLSLGFGGGTRRFPALPNAAWFFFASHENYLSFRDDKPAQGFLTQTFRSPHVPAPILACGGLGLPLLAWPWMARKLRSLFSRVIKEDSFVQETFHELGILEGLDVAHWHQYAIKWGLDRVIFKVDSQTFETTTTPNGPLGFVVWIDNQYLSFPPDGRLSFGTLPNPRSERLEIDELRIEQSA